MNYKSITEINEIVKNILENDVMLKEVYIKGEISNLKYHSRGHIYFSLKDETSKINAVFFNVGNQLLFTPKDGDSVLIRGRINVYAVSGSYQIVVSEMKQDGIGNLYILFEELKKRLEFEGLFDSSHKKKIPRFPEKIGIITSKEGAAVKDIITTINRRYPLCEIYLFPSLVQGVGAKENIVKMIERANKTDIDVLIIGRGGGSIEDLWAFNEEIVARTIYDSNIPIISAVGHEIDYTIADFVADLRAPTPTAAAELAVKNIEDIESYLSDATLRMDKSLLNLVNKYHEKLKSYKINYILNNPLKMYDLKIEKLKSYQEKLKNVYNNNFNNLNNKLENIKIKLELLNPQNILKKGYSIVKIDDKIISSTKKVKIGNELNIILNEGKVIAEVKGIK